MGSLVLYILEWAFALIVLLTIYKAVLSGTTFYRFNRFYLLGATVLSALLPLIHITVPDKTPIVSNMSIDEMMFARELSATFSLSESPEVTVSESSSESGQSSWWAVMLVSMYSVYVLMLIIGWARGIIRAERFLKGKTRRRIGRSVWLVTHGEKFGPFSWMNYIVVSDTESGFARRASLRHEYSHIRLLHSADLIFLLACTIINPACWFVLQEIKIVHEYEADNEVINHYGICNKDYQRLLIMRTVGAEAYALASSFNLNIKKRIIMMNKDKTSKRRLTWLLLLIPLLGMTSFLFARTEKTIGPDNLPNPSVSDNNSAASVIRGKVIGRDGNPIASASVSLLGGLSGMTEPAIRLTDNSGFFSLSVRKGEYIVVSKTGYNQVTVRVDQPDADLTVTLNRTSGDVGGAPTDDETFIVVEEQPEFPGGTTALLGYLAKNIKYPAECRENNIQGRVLVSFTIDKEGYIKEAEVVNHELADPSLAADHKPVDPLLAAEALRVISAMPQWIPGKQRGEPVNVRYTVPINFRLDNGEPPAARRETASGPRPRWIVIYDVKKTAEDENEAYAEMFARGFISLMSSSSNDGESSGILSSPGIADIVKSLKAAQVELDALQVQLSEEIAPMQKEIERINDEYIRQRETLTEEMRASREKEIQESNLKFQEKYRDSQKKVQDRANEMIGSLEPKMKNALQKIEKNRYYICGIMSIEPTIEDIAAAENLESSVNGLFEGHRSMIALPYSENNLQLLKSIIRKHEGKSVYYMNI